MMKKIMLLAAVLLGAAGVFAASVRYPEYSIEGVKDGVVVRDGKGKPMLKIGKQLFSWAPPVARVAGVEQLSPDTLKIIYEIDKDSTGEVALTGTVQALPDGHIKAEWRLDAPASVKTGGIMQEFLPLSGTKKDVVIHKSGLWTRHADGGVPYEENDGYFRSFRNSNASLWMRIGGNVNYSGGWSDHIRYNKAADGRYAGSVEFLVGAPELRGFEAAAKFHNRPVAMNLSTGKPFNIWESGAPQLSVELVNPGSAERRDIAFSVIGRDYDGKVVLERNESIDLAAGERRELVFDFPAAERAIYFVEAQAVVPGEKEVFSRTNLAVLPSHEFEHRDQSTFAMSAYFMIPSEKDVYELMKRMGVHILRHGDNRKCAPYGLVAYDHFSVGPKDSPAAAKEKIDKMLTRAQEFGNLKVEFCNEWNMSQKAEEKKIRARRYVEVLDVFAKERAARKMDIGIIGMGVAGGDSAFLKMIAEAGGLKYLDDGIAMHPGRGNFTADYEGDGWTYLGAIRRFKKTMDELNLKGLHLSEVYAATHPNDSWMDSYRQAAENTVLTFAIGMAEGAESIQFYQLHDSVWHDVGGVRPADREFHYGLLMRDGTIKPSLLAYAAAAEALDGAKFVKYLDFGKKVRGIGFETPRGPLAFLYDRTDGFVLSDRKSKTPHREPWVDHWKSRKMATFDAIGDEVTVIDPIGRASTVKAENGKVTLTLSGAPLMVYGIKF